MRLAECPDHLVCRLGSARRAIVHTLKIMHTLLNISQQFIASISIRLIVQLRIGMKLRIGIMRGWDV